MIEFLKKAGIEILAGLITALVLLLLKTTFKDVPMNEILRYCITFSLYIILIGISVVIVYQFGKWKLGDFIVLKTQAGFKELEDDISRKNQDLDRQITEGDDELLATIKETNRTLETISNSLVEKVLLDRALFYALRYRIKILGDIAISGQPALHDYNAEREFVEKYLHEDFPSIDLNKRREVSKKIYHELDRT